MAIQHDKFIAQSSRTAAKLLDLIGELETENVLFNGAANYDAEITQQILDATPGGLTVAQLADAEAVFANLLQLLTGGALPALAVLKGLYA